MKKLAMASLALSAAAMSFVAPAAQAGPPVDGPEGRLCSYSASSDPAPDADADAMTGQINGGPLAWDRPFTLHCTLQVNSNIHNGASNDTVDEHADSTTADGSTHAAVMDARPVNYDSPENAQDYMCTSVSSASGTIYWHPGTDPDGLPGTGDETAGHWTTDSTKPCSAATQFSTGPIIDAINDVVIDIVDPAVCGAIAAAHTGAAPSSSDAVYVDAEGDVFVTDGGAGITEANWANTLFWDCPKYVDYNSTPIAPGADGADGGVIDY